MSQRSLRRAHLLTLGCALTLATGCWPAASHAPELNYTLDDLLPRRTRPLSRAEYLRSASELLGLELTDGSQLPPDVRSPHGYTRNSQQNITASSGPRLAKWAGAVATRALSEGMVTLPPCKDAKRSACTASFLRALAAKAYRRAPNSAEVTRLLRLFEGLAKRQSRPLALQTVLAALLQSPQFMYLTELGPTLAQPPHNDWTTLTPQEVASALSYTLRGSPPDRELLTAAEQGNLSSSASRMKQGRRLLSLADTRYHFRQFILEWLEVDQLGATAKSSAVFAGYETLKSDMLAETQSFSDEIMVHHQGSLHGFLTAGFASVGVKMAAYYGLKEFGPRVSLQGTPRLGVLQQASFLSAHAHPDSTSPILRGDFVMRKLLCAPTPRPAELDIEVTLPPADKELSARERFKRHAVDPQCMTCHESIDGLGYTFEEFDAAGRSRAEAVATSGEGHLAGVPYKFRDSRELSRWLVAQPAARKCFARQAFRFFAADSSQAEDYFVKLQRGLPAANQDSLSEMLLAWVASDHFIVRDTREPKDSR